MNEFISEFTLGDADCPSIALKDTIDVAGYPTTAASRALLDAPPAPSHADVVDRLLAQGWRVVGKTNMHELAFGMTGINDYTGTPENPQDETRIPGGSSSGSAAAVGLHLSSAALGTDTGGSVRGPAACCGVIGMKPTFGRVSRRGVAPARSTLDCVGPFAREMLTLIDVMAAISPGFDEHVANTAPSSIRIGVVCAVARRLRIAGHRVAQPACRVRCRPDRDQRRNVGRVRASARDGQARCGSGSTLADGVEDDRG